jgi:hypothetical protein
MSAPHPDLLSTPLSEAELSELENAIDTLDGNISTALEDDRAWSVSLNFASAIKIVEQTRRLIEFARESR